jgi:hypothetical protein
MTAGRKGALRYEVIPPDLAGDLFQVTPGVATAERTMSTAIRLSGVPCNVWTYLVRDFFLK